MGFKVFSLFYDFPVIECGIARLTFTRWGSILSLLASTRSSVGRSGQDRNPQGGWLSSCETLGARKELSLRGSDVCTVMTLTVLSALN